MQMRATITPDDELYIHRDDIVGVLREMATDFLGHIPGHVEKGEFLEAVMDRHTAAMYDQAADFFEAQSTTPPPSGVEEGSG